MSITCHRAWSSLCIPEFLHQWNLPPRYKWNKWRKVHEKSMQFYTILYLRYFSIDWCKKIIFFKSFLQREFNNKKFSNVPRTEALVLVDTNASFLYFNLPFNAEQMIALHNNYLWNIALDNNVIIRWKLTCSI